MFEKLATWLRRHPWRAFAAFSGSVGFALVLTEMGGLDDGAPTWATFFVRLGWPLLALGILGSVAGYFYDLGRHAPKETKPQKAGSLRRVFDGEEIRLADITDIRGEQIVSGRTFENCTIYGPSVVYMTGCRIDVFAMRGDDPEDMLIEVPPDRQRVHGVFWLKDCSFFNCRFENIGIIGPKPMLDELRAAVGRGRKA